MIWELIAKGDPPVPFIIFAFLALAIWLAFSSAQARALNRTLGRLASKVGGSVIGGGWFSSPSLDFRVEGRRALLELFEGSKNRTPYSRVVINVVPSPGTLHILEQGFGQEFLKLFGAQDLEIGDESFDREYVIKASPTSMLRRIFSPDRQREGIGIVRRLRGYRNPTFDLDTVSLTVMVRQVLRTEHELLLLLGAAKDFFAFVLRPTSAPEGMVIEEVKVASGGECPVCGTAMTARRVRCESCRTPHHSECWQYMGRCSTYACKGTRTVA